MNYECAFLFRCRSFSFHSLHHYTCRFIASSSFLIISIIFIFSRKKIAPLKNLFCLRVKYFVVMIVTAFGDILEFESINKPQKYGILLGVAHDSENLQFLMKLAGVRSVFKNVSVTLSSSISGDLFPLNFISALSNLSKTVSRARSYLHDIYQYR